MKKISLLLLIIITVVSLTAFASKNEEPSYIEFEQSYEKSYFDYYRNVLKKDTNILLTSDLLFYIEHLYADYSLRYIEKTYLIDKYKILLKEIINKNDELYGNETKLKKQYEMINAYLYTALKIIDKNCIVPANIENIVNNEISKISEHSGEKPSSVFNRTEDFSQYIPRGHYNDSELLRQYFKSMMYFQRMRFRTIVKDEDKYIELKSILMLSNIFKDNVIIKTHKELYDVISYYLQASDDLLISGIDKIINNKLTISNIMNPDILKEIAKTLSASSISKINSDIIYDYEDKPIFVGIMGQRYIFDSEVFQNLVYDKVGSFTGSLKRTPFTYGSGFRVFPRGLDLMYVLGSGEAYSILKEENDISYIGYHENVNAMKEKVLSLQDGNYYNDILKQFIIVIKSNEFSFLKGSSKRIKELNTMLSAWASLRHDVILYAKQSYTMKITSAKPFEPNKPIKRIITEPYTTLYPVMKSNIKTINSKLYEYTSDEMFYEFEYAFNQLIDMYQKISLLTLSGKVYNDDKKVLNILNNVDIALKRFIRDKKDKTDNTLIIADVHTEPNSKMVLEQASGFVYNMYIGFEGNRYKGGVLSYYEFKHPMSDRLSDEKWREIADSAEKYLSPWQRGLYEGDFR